MSNDSASTSEVESLSEMVSGRYGSRLSPKELEHVRKGVGAIVEAADALRAVELQNSDGPGTLFQPYRQDG